MSHEGYATFCPLSKACELLEPRWTMLVLAEMSDGSTRFNEIRRGLPAMSPTLLSRRLKDLEQNGLVERVERRATGDVLYLLTEKARTLLPVIKALALWAHRNVDAEVTLCNLDAGVLMWNMRRKVDTDALPKGRRSTIQFIFPELPKDEQNYWLIAKPGAPVDLCRLDPGYDVDLYITCDLRALTSAWMGHSELATEIARQKIVLIGDPLLARGISAWMVRSSLAEAGHPVRVQAA